VSERYFETAVLEFVSENSLYFLLIGKGQSLHGLLAFEADNMSLRVGYVDFNFFEGC